MMQSKIISKLVPRWGSIQTQLILGFGPILILTLITAIAGYWGLQSLRTGIETTIEEASQVRELSREIENEFLLARQSEADFVAKWRSMGFAAAEAEYIAANQRHLAQAQTALDEIESLTRAAHDEELRGMTAPIAERASSTPPDIPVSQWLPRTYKGYCLGLILPGYSSTPMDMRASARYGGASLTAANVGGDNK